MSQETMLVLLSTVGPILGSAIGVLKKPSTVYIQNMLAFAAGIMMTISFLDLIPESVRLGSTVTCVAGLAIGATFMAAVDRLIPQVHECAVCREDPCPLGRTANFLILAIFVHNFPEGMAIAVGTASGIGNSFVIALAIAVHNIPEGICTSAPHYYAHGNRLRSFGVSSLSTLPILLGFWAARHLFANIAPSTMSLWIGATAGLMIYITAMELMPAAQKGGGRRSMIAFMTGIIAVMLLELAV
jgi:ZIP family zinc transporter